jgi:hypothetical protein
MPLFPIYLNLHKNHGVARIDLKQHVEDVKRPWFLYRMVQGSEHLHQAQIFLGGENQVVLLREMRSISGTESLKSLRDF